MDIPIATEALILPYFFNDDVQDFLIVIDYLLVLHGEIFFHLCTILNQDVKIIFWAKRCILYTTECGKWSSKFNNHIAIRTNQAKISDCQNPIDYKSFNSGLVL